MKVELMDMSMVRGHVVVNDGEGHKLLIDTGSPVTFGDIKRFAWDGRHVQPQPTNLWGVDIAEIRKMGGIDFDALVGTDLLSQKPFTIDTYRGEFVLGTLNGKGQYKISTYRGSPRVDLSVNGVEGNALIDTGAVKSFFEAQPEWGLSEGNHEDFYPTLGKFTAPQWLVPVEVFDSMMHLHVVEPPEALRNSLGMVGAHGILGMDILKYGALGFDLSGGRASFERYEG
jgi:hypothetical protein